MNKSISSWISYDVANTLFNFGVVGVFLPLWIEHRPGTTDADLGFPIAISMTIVLISSPFLGALTDQLRGRMRAFTFLNILGAASTFLIGFSDTVSTTLMFFSIAFICVYLAELLYNAMLEVASNPQNRGKVGGLGIGFGYVGSLLVIGFALLYGGNNSDYSLEFKVFGVAFLLAALPIAMFFEDREKEVNRSTGMLIKSTLAQIKKTRNYFQQHPKIPRFFAARYFYMIAVTTSSTFAVRYGMNTIGFSEREVMLVLLLGTVVAIPGAVMWGFIVDKVGPANALKWNVFGWVLLLVGAVAIPWLNLNSQLWWPLSAILGLYFGGLWAADRPLLIQISPNSNSIGEMFGIYGAVSRLAYLTGALMWPLISTKVWGSVGLGLGQPAAIVFLLCCGIVAWILLIRLQNSSR